MLEGSVPVFYLEDFEWRSARVLYGGTDLWLNTAKRPQEASGPAE